jgi:hypothetical protein
MIATFSDRNERRRPYWFWFALGLLLGLSGCGTVLDPAGTTHASYSHTADGGETIEIHDGKDRAAFSAAITKPDGTQFTVNSTDSNGSVAQANAMAAQADALNKVITLIQSGALVAGKAAITHTP